MTVNQCLLLVVCQALHLGERQSDAYRVLYNLDFMYSSILRQRAAMVSISFHNRLSMVQGA